MDIFDWEELTAEMLNVSDEQRESEDYLPAKFYQRFNIDFEDAYNLAQELIKHTMPLEAGLSGKSYHAFVSREAPIMLMKIEASKKGV